MVIFNHNITVNRNESTGDITIMIPSIVNAQTVVAPVTPPITQQAKPIQPVKPLFKAKGMETLTDKAVKANKSKKTPVQEPQEQIIDIDDFETMLSQLPPECLEIVQMVFISNGIPLSEKDLIAKLWEFRKQCQALEGNAVEQIRLGANFMLDLFSPVIKKAERGEFNVEFWKNKSVMDKGLNIMYKYKEMLKSTMPDLEI